MNLDDMTRDQLKEECKNRGIQKYHAWGKTELIKAITKHDYEKGILTNPADDLNEEEAKQGNLPEGSKILSPQALKWKEYFSTTQISPKDFLTRYPNHKYKVFISELL